MRRFALAFLCLGCFWGTAQADKLWTASEYLGTVAEAPVPSAGIEQSFLGSQPLTSISSEAVTANSQQPILAPQQQVGQLPVGGASFNNNSGISWDVPRRKGSVARITVDGYLYSRDGVGDDYPLLFDDAFPNGDVILKTNDLGFSGETGGQVNIDLPLVHFGFFTSGTAEERVTKTASPADIWFFNAHAADDKDTYTVQYDSTFRMFDIGFRKDVDQVTSVYGGVAFGRLRERMDILSTLNPPEGFFSSVENDLLGGHIGGRREFFNNGNFRIEAAGVAGLYFNEIEVRAQAAGIDQPWDDDAVAYSLLGNLTVVIPAWPVNFRLGYQAQLIGGVAVSPEASRSLQIIDGGGGIETSEVIYHGFLFGVEKQW